MSDNLDLVVLKTLVSNKKYALDFVNECDPKLFNSDVWNFANLVTGYIRTYKDLPTLRVLVEKLSKGGNTNVVDHVKKIWSQLESIETDEKEYKHELEKIKRRYAEKQLSSMKDSLSKLEPGKTDISKILGDVQKTVQNIRALDKSKTYESKNIKEHLPYFVDKFNAKKADPELEVGLKTKYSFFDFATNGVKPADMVLISGESGFGKSLLLNNIAVQIWMQDNTIEQTSNFSNGKNIIYFSLEMPYEDCFNRLLGRLSGVPIRNIENAKLSKDEFAKIKLALDFISNYPYNFKIVDIVDASADDLEVILTECGEDFDAVFIDYLGIMQPNQKSDEADWLKQGIIAYEVRAIARRYKLPIFSAVQLNRKSSKGESSENIGLSRLARSGTIATHATHVIQIENRPQEENYPDFIYHIIKNRKGPKGKGSLIKNLSCATLIDKVEGVPTDHYDDYFPDQDDISYEMDNLEL